MVSGSPAEPGRALAGVQDSPAWRAIHATEAIGADFGAEGPRIQTPVQNPGRIDAGDAIGAGVECVRGADGDGGGWPRVASPRCARRRAYD